MKERLESVVENGERRDAGWCSLVEPTKQEKQSRFSRIGKKIEDIVRFFVWPEGKTSRGTDGR